MAELAPYQVQENHLFIQFIIYDFMYFCGASSVISRPFWKILTVLESSWLRLSVVCQRFFHIGTPYRGNLPFKISTSSLHAALCRYNLTIDAHWSVNIDLRGSKFHGDVPRSLVPTPIKFGPSPTSHLRVVHDTVHWSWNLKSTNPYFFGDTL